MADPSLLITGHLASGTSPWDNLLSSADTELEGRLSEEPTGP